MIRLYKYLINLNRFQNEIIRFRRTTPKLDSLIRAYSVKHAKQNEKEKIPPRSSQDIKIEEPPNPSFLLKNIGLTHVRWSSVIEKHPEIKSLNRQNLASTIKALKSLNYSAEEIESKPTILCIGSNSIENRHDVLCESGLNQPISIGTLFKYITILNKSVALLKSYQYIPWDVNVLENLCSHFTDVEIKIKRDEINEINENLALKRIRQIVLNSYFRQRLDMNDEEIAKVWRSYSRVRHKSFRSVQSVIEILQNELHFPKERIVKNGFLLYGDARNIKRIISEIPTIGGQDIKDIGFRRPKILMSNCDLLLKTLQYVKMYGIDETAVTRCLEVLTLGPETVLERLRDLNEIEEFQVLATNPRVLRLVHYQNKARLRLEYLNQLKVRCASLHILSCGSEAFAKFARDGSDRTKGRDIVVYLAKVFGQDENNVRSLMSRHPNWCHIPVLHVKHCYEYLLSQKFENEDIFKNMHLLLYPIKRIEEKLSVLNHPESIENIDLPYDNVTELSNNEILTLLLYLIECEFHFTGDGIWTEQQTHQMENFSNLLPDFPESLNKVYKYGVKPAGSQAKEASKNFL